MPIIKPPRDEDQWIQQIKNISHLSRRVPPVSMANRTAMLCPGQSRFQVFQTRSGEAMIQSMGGGSQNLKTVEFIV